MFNSEKMRKTMVVVMLLELLLLIGLLVNGVIQDQTRLHQRVEAVAAQVTTLTQEQQKIANELNTVQEEVLALGEQVSSLEKQAATLQSEVKTLQQEVKKLKKSCTGKPTCCKSKCKGKTDCGNSSCKRDPSKDKQPPNKKPECGNDKGTTSPPAMHQVEMYYGATKVIISVPPPIPISQ